MSDNVRTFPLNVLIVGNKGHGKTSIANSLIQRSNVENPSAETRFVKGNYEIHKIYVIDSAAGTENNPEESLEIAVNSFPAGIIVFMIVIKIDEHKSGNWKTIVNKWKTILGPRLFELYGVVAFSFGDKFKKIQPGNPHGTFSEWCEQQTGDLRKLFAECQGRVMLCNNINTNIKNVNNNPHGDCVNHKLIQDLIESSKNILPSNPKIVFDEHGTGKGRGINWLKFGAVTIATGIISVVIFEVLVRK